MSRDRLPRPFDAIRRELAEHDDTAGNTLEPESMRLDTSRAARTGIPEVVYAEFKTDQQVVESMQILAARSGRALAARCRPGTLSAIQTTCEPELVVVIDDLARTAIVARHEAVVSPSGGRIGVIAAGTSDLPVAREAATIAVEMGCDVVAVNDVGVAGLYRLVRPLETLVAKDVASIIVVAGMDGALPSVVAGLVGVPVIGLPTSVGYGYGGGGEAALGSMLQTCVPGLVVVNIDNGVGAGATAALIANGIAARSRSGT